MKLKIKTEIKPIAGIFIGIDVIDQALFPNADIHSNKYENISNSDGNDKIKHSIKGNVYCFFNIWVIISPSIDEYSQKNLKIEYTFLMN